MVQALPIETCKLSITLSLHSSPFWFILFHISALGLRSKVLPFGKLQKYLCFLSLIRTFTKQLIKNNLSKPKNKSYG